MKISDFKKEEQLAKMKVTEIRKHIKQFNEHYVIKGYSKVKKDQLINMVLTAQDRIRNSMKKKPRLVVVKDSPKKKEAPKSAEKPASAEKKLSYAEGKKIKNEIGRPYFSWSNQTIPIKLWEKSSRFNTGDPSPKEIQKFTKSSLAKYRKVFQSRHGSEMKTEKEWKQTWLDFADEIRKQLQ